MAEGRAGGADRRGSPSGGLARRRIAALLPLLAALALAGCAAPSAPSAPASAPPLCAPAAQRALSCGLYVAVAAETDGRAQPWLPTEPIRLWFEPLNGARTAIIDAPVNTSNVPTLGSGPVLWHANTASESAVGCGRGCQADGFVQAMTAADADYTESDGTITITAAGRTLVVAPTSAPDPDRSGCDASAVDAFPCRRFVSVTGTDGGRRVGALRTDPLRVEVSGSGAHRTAAVRDGGAVLTVPVSVVDGTASTPSAAARTPSPCPTQSSCARLTALAAQLAHGATWAVHASSVLVTGPGWTLQLEAAPR